MKAFHKRNLLPVKIESFDENDIPAPFNLIQSIDLSAWNGRSDDPIWLALEDDIQDLIARAIPVAPIVIDEAYDEEAMANELFSAVAVGTGPMVTVEPILNAVELAEVKAFIESLVGKAGGTISQAAVAAALRTKWPAKIGQFNWFGHKKFSKFFESLGFRHLQLDPATPGKIFTTQENVLSIGKAAERGQPISEEFGRKVFEATGAPPLPSIAYRQLLKAIASAILSGASTVSEISKIVREELASTDTPVSRARASFVAKGALIGGLNIKQIPMKAAMVALCYANSLSALAAANGCELSIAEQDQLLGLIGFADL
jgi:hypothetical protein